MPPGFDWSAFASSVASTGIFGTLFVVLFYYELRSSEKREDRMAHRLDVQDANIDKLSGSLSILSEQISRQTSLMDALVKSVERQTILMDSQGKIQERIANLIDLRLEEMRKRTSGGA